MILQTLTLHNFRKFKHVSIEFPEGIIGIVGLNGVGKSSIFEAIAWALYGSVAARTSSEEIKRVNAEPSDPCRVDIGFVFEGNEFRVVRELTGKAMNASATVTMNNKLAATGAGPSSQFIQKTLGMDFKSFFTSIFARQKELNTLSSMNASERRPLILRMLGIDSLDGIIKEINSDKKLKNSLITYLENNLKDELGNDKGDLLKRQLEDVIKEQKTMKEEKKNLKAQSDQIKEEKSEIKKQLENAKKTYESCKKEYENAMKEKNSFEQKNKLELEIERLTKKIENRTSDLNKLNEKFKTFKDVGKEIDGVEKRIREIQITSTDFIKKIEQKKSMINHISNHVNEIALKEGSIEKLGPDASCPTCERILGNQFNDLLSKYNDKKQALMKEKDRFKKEEQKLIENHEKFQREKTALQKKKEFLRKQLTEKEKIIITIKTLEKEKLNEQKELEKKQKQLLTFSGLKFDKASFETIQKNQKQYYEDYEVILKEFNKINENFSKITLELEKKHSSNALLKQRIQSIEAQKKELNKMKEQIKDEQKNASELNMIRDVMTSFRQHLISRIRPILSNYATFLFHDLTDGKYPELTLDEQYNIEIYDEGQSYAIQRFSGGEIDLANLSLRLAISDVITERAGGLFQFIILDEIFGSQDMIRQQNIMNQLYKLSSKFKQIFLITHIENVKHYMQHIINVQEIDNLSSIKIN